MAHTFAIAISTWRKPMRISVKLAILGGLIGLGAIVFIMQEWEPNVLPVRHGNTHNLVGKDWKSPNDHGWKDEIPTANSPTSLRKD
jgi:hypothetical protein